MARLLGSIVSIRPLPHAEDLSSLLLFSPNASVKSLVFFFQFFCPAFLVPDTSLTLRNRAALR